MVHHLPWNSLCLPSLLLLLQHDRYSSQISASVSITTIDQEMHYNNTKSMICNISNSQLLNLSGTVSCIPRDAVFLGLSLTAEFVADACSLGGVSPDVAAESVLVLFLPRPLPTVLHHTHKHQLRSAAMWVHITFSHTHVSQQTAMTDSHCAFTHKASNCFTVHVTNLFSCHISVWIACTWSLLMTNAQCC